MITSFVWPLTLIANVKCILITEQPESGSELEALVPCMLSAPHHLFIWSEIRFIWVTHTYSHRNQNRNTAQLCFNSSSEAWLNACKHFRPDWCHCCDITGWGLRNRAQKHSPRHVSITVSMSTSLLPSDWWRHVCRVTVIAGPGSVLQQVGNFITDQ